MKSKDRRSLETIEKIQNESPAELEAVIGSTFAKLFNNGQRGWTGTVHRTWATLSVLTREWLVNCSAFILMFKILFILCSYVIICVRWTWNGSFQSEKLTKKRKVEMEGPELWDARNEKRRKQYAGAKKNKGKKPLKRVIEAQRLKWRTRKQNSNLLSTLAVSWISGSASEFSVWVAGLQQLSSMVFYLPFFV